MATLVLTDTQQSILTAQPLDAKGNPADFDAPATWASADETIVTIQDVSADGLTATAFAVGPVGTTQVSITGLEQGSPLVGTLDVQVVGGNAVSVGISAGTPTEQP